jgi:flavin reductase (DIM6/NTAB) family NADH-FMN oxidoreductase RutF
LAAVTSRRDWPPIDRAQVADLLEGIPSGRFLITSRYGDQRSAALVRWVQQAAVHPPMVVVAIEKGQALSPIIRDSRNFALCRVADDDPLVDRIFQVMPELGRDPFLGLPHMSTPSLCPVPLRADWWLDCEMVRYLDIEADHEMYIACVHHAGRLENGEAVHRRVARSPAKKASAKRPLKKRSR